MSSITFQIHAFLPKFVKYIFFIIKLSCNSATGQANQLMKRFLFFKLISLENYCTIGQSLWCRVFCLYFFRALLRAPSATASARCLKQHGKLWRSYIGKRTCVASVAMSMADGDGISVQCCKSRTKLTHAMEEIYMNIDMYSTQQRDKVEEVPRLSQIGGLFAVLFVFDRN